MVPIKLIKIWKREDGAITVVAAIVFVAVLAFSGLVVDLGSAYMQESATQNAADAAAFAVSSILPIAVDDADKIQQATQIAAEYAQKNGIGNVESVTLEDSVGGKYYSVRVSLTDEVSYYFGPIVGIDGTTVTKAAKVKLETVSSTTGAVPLGIETSRLDEALLETGGQDLVIKYGGGGGTEGFFGALDLDGVKGGGAQDFESWLCFGYDGVLRVGDILPVEPGNMSGPTTDAFVTRYTQCTHFPSQGGCTVEHFDPNCPRVVLIIVYTTAGNKQIQVEGFAPFVLEGLNGNGEIVASKVDLHVQSGEIGGVPGGAGDYGIYRARLVE